MSIIREGRKNFHSSCEAIASHPDALPGFAKVPRPNRAPTPFYSLDRIGKRSAVALNSKECLFPSTFGLPPLCDND